MSRIVGLYDKKDDDKDKKNPRTEEFNMGGAQSSTAVQRPVRGRDGTLTGDLAEHARAANHRPEDVPSSSTITLYRNGFIVGQGAFRDLAVPANQTILAALKKGEVPREIEADLAAGSDERDVGVTLVNHSTEDYVPPKAKFDFKTSQGQSLGGGDTAPAASFAGAAAREIVLKPGEPTGVIMLVLHPRERVKITVNESTTVLDVYQHMKHLSKIDKFQMLAGFPPAPLTNPSATVKEARLINSSVQQQL